MRCRVEINRDACFAEVLIHHCVFVGQTPLPTARHREDPRATPRYEHVVFFLYGISLASVAAHIRHAVKPPPIVIIVSDRADFGEKHALKASIFDIY